MNRAIQPERRMHALRFFFDFNIAAHSPKVFLTSANLFLIFYFFAVVPPLLYFRIQIALLVLFPLLVTRTRNPRKFAVHFIVSG